MSNDSNIVSTINNHSKNNDTNAAHMSNHPKYPNVPPIDVTDIDFTDIEKFNTNKICTLVVCHMDGRHQYHSIAVSSMKMKSLTTYQPTSDYFQLIYVTI
jgi:hypothetical protein